MRRAFEPFPTISIVVPVDLKLTDFTVRSHTSCARVPVAYIKLNKTMSLKPVSLFWSGSARRIFTSSVVKPTRRFLGAFFDGILNTALLKVDAASKS